MSDEATTIFALLHDVVEDTDYTLKDLSIMGFSRIYIQVHYCSDVIAGVVSGAMSAVVAVLIVKYLCPVISDRLTKHFSKSKCKKAE